jgi:hypothetical protein
MIYPHLLSPVQTTHQGVPGTGVEETGRDLSLGASFTGSGLTKKQRVKGSIGDPRHFGADPTPFSCDFKDVRKQFFSKFFSFTSPAGTFCKNFYFLLNFV